MRVIALALLFAAATPALAGAPTPEATTRKAQGDARRDGGDATGALAAYREAIQISPDYVEAWEEIGKLYFGAKKFAEAADAFQHAVDVDASFANNWFNLALASRRAGDLGKSRDAFRRYLAIKPSDGDARLRMADVLRALGEREAAASEYTAVVAAADARTVEPALGDRAKTALAQMKAEAPAPPPAAPAPPVSIPLPPAPEPARPTAASGVPTPAPAAPPTPYASPVAPVPAPAPRPVAEPVTPPSPALLDKLALGDRLQGSGDQRGALFAYQDAVYLDPRHAVARVKLGRSYWALRYVGQAEEQWAQAMQLAPNDPSIARMIEEARKAPRPALSEPGAAGEPSLNGSAPPPAAVAPGAGSAAGAPPRIYKLAPEPQPAAGSWPQQPSGATTPGYGMPAPAAAAPQPQYAPPQYAPQPASPPQQAAASEYAPYAQPQSPVPPYGQQPAPQPSVQPPYAQPAYPQQAAAPPQYGQPPPPSASASAAAQRYKAAISLYIQRDYLGAIAELDAAITLDPNLSIAYTARGSARFGLGKFREASADYRAALDLDASRAEPIWGLAECQRMLKDPAAPDTYRRYAASLAADVNEERRARARRWASDLSRATR